MPPHACFLLVAALLLVACDGSPVPALPPPAQGLANGDASEAPLPVREAISTQPDEVLIRRDGVLSKLRLRLVDERTGAPAASDVDLWMLGVPGNEEWTDGDVIERSVHVPAEGVELERVPAGRYRLYLRGASSASDDPPAFDVPSEGEVAARFRPSGTTRLRLRVFRADGSIARTATRVSFAGGTRDTRRPRWSSPPSLRATDGDWSRFRGIGYGHTGQVRKRTEFHGDDDGLDLGPLADARRDVESTSYHQFELEDGSVVRLSLDSEKLGDGRFVAVAAAPGALVGHVRLPDGRPATDAGASVRASTGVAFPATDDATWRNPPVSVTVGLAGYETIEFEWRPAESARAPVTLRPLAR